MKISKVLFSRNALLVKIAEVLGVSLFIIAIVRDGLPNTTLGKSAIIVYALLYLSIRIAASLSWYNEDGTNHIFPPRIKRDIHTLRGIELHFRKALIPTSYMTLISACFLIFRASPNWLYVTSFLLLIVAHVNFILLYLHIKDQEGTPVNLFTKIPPNS